MILIATQTFPPVVGGMENLMRGLADAFVQCGEAVAVFADAKGDAAEKIIDAECAFIVRRFGGPRILRRIRKARIIARESQNAKAVVADSWQDRGGEMPSPTAKPAFCATEKMQKKWKKPSPRFSPPLLGLRRWASPPRIARRNFLGI